MGVIQAVDLAIEGQTQVDAFKIFYKGQGNNVYAASCLRGGAGRTKYIKNWWGWFSGVGFFPAHFPGDDVNLVASLDGTHGFTGTAKIGTVEIRGSIEEGGPVRFVTQFGGNSALVRGSAAVSLGGDAVYYDGTDMLVLADDVAEQEIREIVLRFSRPFAPYSASGLPGVVRRNTGDPLDAVVQWKLYQDTPSVLKEINDLVSLKVKAVTGAGAAQYWTLNKCKIESLDDFGGQRMSPENIGGTMIAALDVTQGGTALGTITNPLGAQVFPQGSTSTATPEASSVAPVMVE